MAHRNMSFASSAPLPKHRVSELLSAGWARVIAKIGKGTFADRLQTTTRTIEGALAGSTVPEAHTVLNSLTTDPTALDELLAGYGLRVVPLHSDAANDIETAAGVIAAMGKLVAAQADGVRDHNETLIVASLLRPHLPAINAIVQDADRMRGVA